MNLIALLLLVINIQIFCTKAFIASCSKKGWRTNVLSSSVLPRRCYNQRVNLRQLKKIQLEYRPSSRQSQAASIFSANGDGTIVHTKEYEADIATIHSIHDNVRSIVTSFITLITGAMILFSASSQVFAAETPYNCYTYPTPTNTAIQLVSTTIASTNTQDVGSYKAVAYEKKYDGFADYAKENQMQQSDVGCFMNKCGDQTKALFSNPRGIKGVSCLGRCKGEQACATRCFAEFGSEDLNNWLSCTIEENDCVKVPRNVDNSAENVGFRKSTPQHFDPKSLVGTWYKTDGLNPNYDLFDCQTNTFTPSLQSPSEFDMDIFFRVSRPDNAGGGYWENALTEHMVVDAVGGNDAILANPSGRTMHTQGKMYGLKFSENWYIIGESDGTGDVPPYKLVAYKGHTLQGNYEGAFVYAKEPVLPVQAIPSVRKAAIEAGLNFDEFTHIDNSCPTDTKPLNDAFAGTGTSTTDWVNLLVGEGGIIDWISPGWRGEYK